MAKRDGKYRSILGARVLRKNSTKTETILWKYLNNRGMCGFKFRRQYPIDRFVIDFYCPEQRLAIEIDGKIHDNRNEYDKERQETISSHGINFLRFKNSEVMNSIDTVLRTIKRKLIPSQRQPNENEGSLLLGEEKGLKG